MPTKKVKFICRKCGAETEADAGSQRAQQAVCRTCFGKKADLRTNRLNNLTGSQWAKYSKSVETYPDTRSVKQREHGACFPKSLARQQIEIYSKPGELVFDPFVGVGTTVDAALELGRRAVGIELNPKFADLCLDSIRWKIGKTQPSLRAMQTTCWTTWRRKSVDFLLTSPPYANLLRSVKGNFAYKWREQSDIDPISNPRPYSDLDNDIGNMDYADGIALLGEIMDKCFRVQKPDSYAVWVVKDFRNSRKGIPMSIFTGISLRLRPARDTRSGISESTIRRRFARSLCWAIRPATTISTLATPTFLFLRKGPERQDTEHDPRALYH